MYKAQAIDWSLSTLLYCFILVVDVRYFRALTITASHDNRVAETGRNFWRWSGPTACWKAELSRAGGPRPCLDGFGVCPIWENPQVPWYVCGYFPGEFFMDLPTECQLVGHQWLFHEDIHGMACVCLLKRSGQPCLGRYQV